MCIRMCPNVLMGAQVYRAPAEIRGQLWVSVSGACHLLFEIGSTLELGQLGQGWLVL